MVDLIKLDPNSVVPKYLQIIDAILHNISVGNIKIGDKMPSINKLSKDIYLSRDTVERAYSILKKTKGCRFCSWKRNLYRRNRIYI